VSAAIGWVDEHALGPSLPAVNIPTS
jgi:hypothetical protein